SSTQEWIKTLEEIQKLVAKNNWQNFNYYRRQGNDRSKLEEYSEAIAYYTKALSEQKFSGIGVGLEINPVNNTVVVTKIVKNSSAIKAGIKTGDRILAIDQQPTINMSPGEVVNLIRGQTGTQVTLLIGREDHSEEITLARTSIAADSRFAEVYYNRGIAYSEVGDNSKALEDLQKAAELYQQQENQQMYQQVQEKLQELNDSQKNAGVYILLGGLAIVLVGLGAIFAVQKFRNVSLK
ncbi:MAG: tetratricopeptide repeat protein, partial [Okeania sp. SIO2H7]|nr:tetratricopeptide repeat protein [Okeania sp. SIO2H7]